MQKFVYEYATKVYFGEGVAKEHLADAVSGYGENVMLAYGGGSVKKNGIYDEVKEILEGAGKKVFDFNGIMSNPAYAKVQEGAKLAKEGKIDFILAVGGGSTLDGTKFIAAAAKYEGGDPYEGLIVRCEEAKAALPLADVITLPATGSEMNNGAVVSRIATNEKLPFHSDLVFPKFSIIDPQVTFSLPVRQTINGIVDTFVHVMEQYCTYDVNTPLQDDWALGILRTLISEAPKVLAEPEDYEARANIFWCATCGLNYWISLGAVQDWATHMIGHELTAFYGIDHGQSLAIVLPRLLKNQKVSKSKKLAKLAREVFGVQETVDLKAADKAIENIEEFFNSIGMKTKLSDYEIDAMDAAEKVRERFAARNVAFGEKGAITADTAYEILKNC